jgi:hypothetical protein
MKQAAVLSHQTTACDMHKPRDWDVSTLCAKIPPHASKCRKKEH